MEPSSSSPPKLPSLPALYWCDFTIRRAIRALVFGLLIAIAIPWVTKPIPGTPPTEPTFEVIAAPWLSRGGWALAALSAAILLWRYQRVRTILGQGARIKGVIDELDVYSRTNENASSTTTPFRTPKIHSYYVTIRYPAGGREQKVRLKLPNSGFTFGLAKGGEVDLMVLESAPDKPLIRPVYLGRQ